MKHLENTLRSKVQRISVERNVLRAYRALKETETYIREVLSDMGYEVREQRYEVEGREVANL